MARPTVVNEWKQNCYRVLHQPLTRKCFCWTVQPEWDRGYTVRNFYNFSFIIFFKWRHPYSLEPFRSSAFCSAYCMILQVVLSSEWLDLGKSKLEEGTSFFLMICAHITALTAPWLLFILTDPILCR